MLKRATPLFLVVILWAAGFGQSTYISIFILLGLHDGKGTSETSWITAGYSILGDLTQGALLITCAILATRYIGKASYEDMGLKLFKNDRPILSTYKVASIYLVIIFIGEGVQILGNKLAGDSSEQENVTVQDITVKTIGSVLRAGPTEEIVLVMALVILLSVARLKPWMILAAAVLARISFHLYYGWEDAFGLAIWALLTIFLWKVFPNVWALAIGHAVWNFQVSANLYEFGALTELIATVLFYAALISGLFFVVKDANFIQHAICKEPFGPGQGHPAWPRKNDG